jgi:hypothetical protein
VRRPFHLMAVLGMAAHNVFELAAGVGLILQPQLGLRGASALWGGALPATAFVAGRGSERWEGPLAVGLGGALGAVVVHYVVWPWRLRRGIPVLTEAEGLRGRALAAYNLLLLAWGTVALFGLSRETPGRHRTLVALSAVGTVASGLAPGPFNINNHFKWLREQARSDPAWWNRAGATS